LRTVLPPDGTHLRLIGPAKPVINGQRLIEYGSQNIRVNAVSPA
jgi:hypothetical protein